MFLLLDVGDDASQIVFTDHPDLRPVERSSVSIRYVGVGYSSTIHIPDDIPIYTPTTRKFSGHKCIRSTDVELLFAEKDREVELNRTCIVMKFCPPKSFKSPSPTFISGNTLYIK